MLAPSVAPLKGDFHASSNICVLCAPLFPPQGVVKALFEHRMLPRVMAGSSVGSIVAGIVATRTDDELRETFRWALTQAHLGLCDWTLLHVA